MRILDAMVLVLAATLPLHASSAADFFVGKYAEADQEVGYHRLQGDFGDYVLVTLDGYEAFVMDNVTGLRVEDPALVESLLVEDVYGRADFAGNSGRLEQIMSGFNSTKYGSERKCRQYTGTGTHRCIDRESCIVACFAVPVCTALVNADGFWGAIFNWSRNTDEINSLSPGFLEGLPAMAGGGEAVDAQIGKVDRLLALSQENMGNGLFKNASNSDCVDGSNTHCYDFCPHIDYSLEELLEARSILFALKAELSELGLQANRTAIIMRNGKAQVDYVNSRGSLIAKHRLFVVTLRYNASKAYDEAGKVAHDPELDLLMAQLNATINASDEFEREGRFKAMFATAKGIKSTVDEVWKRSQAVVKTRRGLLERLNVTGQKIAKAEQFGAPNSTVRGLNFTYMRLSEKLSGKANSSEFDSISSQVSGLDGEAEAALLAALLSANGTASSGSPDTISIGIPKSLPCPLPAAAAIVLLGAYLARGRDDSDRNI